MEAEADDLGGLFQCGCFGVAVLILCSVRAILQV